MIGAIVSLDFFVSVVHVLLDLIVWYCVRNAANYSFPICSSQRLCEVILLLFSGRFGVAGKWMGSFRQARGGCVVRILFLGQ